MTQCSAWVFHDSKHQPSSLCFLLCWKTKGIATFTILAPFPSPLGQKLMKSGYLSYYYIYYIITYIIYYLYLVLPIQRRGRLLFFIAEMLKSRSSKCDLSHSWLFCLVPSLLVHQLLIIASAPLIPSFMKSHV